MPKLAAKHLLSARSLTNMNINITKIISLIIGFAGLLTSINAQQYESYKWDNERTLTKLTTEEENYPLYQIQKSEKYEFAYDSANNNSLVCFVTNHEIIRVNNDEALSKSNQIYIPLYNTIELVDIKARAITKDGRMINFDETNIKELADDESGYKIFAIEGAEVGGEIEYYYTRKTYSNNFFTRYFQFNYPVKSFDFSLKCPENLEYDFKIYNLDAKVNQTDTAKAFNNYSFSAQDIPELHNEDFGAYENSKMRLEGKLAYNSVSGSGRLFTWADAGKRVYDQIYTLDKSEQKELAKFIKSLNLSGSPIEAFKRTEHMIKTNFFLEEDAGDMGMALNSIIKNKYATSKGFTKLYAAILNHLNIKHEIVLTSDRFKRAFDPNFDSWNYLDEYLIYISDADQFLSPKDTPFRLGTIPTVYLATYGLFIGSEKIQNFTYPISRIGFIPAPSYKENFDNMDIDVAFSESLDMNTVSLTRSYKGYSAQYYKAATLFLEEERKKEILDDVIKYLALDAEIEKVEIVALNNDYKTWNELFTVDGKFKTNSYIESAGDIILFKVGELIGAQSEMYQEKERDTPIVNDFNRGYLRKIHLKIPEGYSIQNPDDIIIKEQVFEDSLIYNFESRYTITGQDLEIEIDEFYDKIYFPVEKFEPFRKVINAAADWNKIVLVMKEK
ncbi:MAG: hypothetical protein ACJA08_000448 [Cyclobacteriaceae bacterium]|jgi:hypothetical protein